MASNMLIQQTDRQTDSQMTKVIYAKPTGSTILNDGRLKLPFSISSECQARAIDQEKEIKSSLLERKK